MSKHVLDHERPVSGSRAARYADIERQRAEDGRDRNTETLHRRPATREGARTREFLRQEREHEG